MILSATIKIKAESSLTSIMVELTLSISDELATRLEPLRDRLPQLLESVLETADKETSTPSQENQSFPLENTVYAEVLDFLIKRPTPQEIMAFKASPQAQARLRTLLTKNREASLTSEETAELDVYEQLEHLMILLKAHAIKAIS